MPAAADSADFSTWLPYSISFIHCTGLEMTRFKGEGRRGPRQGGAKDAEKILPKPVKKYLIDKINFRNRSRHRLRK